MDVDPAYEYEAPMFVDFTAPPQDDTGVDLWFDGKRSFGGVAAMDTMEDLPQAVQAAAGEMSMAPAAQAPAAVPQPEHPSSDRAAAAVAPSVEEPAVAVAATKPRPANLRTSWGGSRRTQVATKTAGAGREHRVQQGGTGRSAKRAGPPAAPAPKRKEMPKKANSASRLTQPKTPEMMKRGRRSSVKRAKTSEELELEKIKAMRKSFAKKRKLSANSFKKMKCSTEYVPVRSTKPLTEPQEFHFAQGSSTRRPSHSMRLRSSPKQRGAANGMILRDLSQKKAKQPMPAKLAAPKVTKPRPFKLSGMSNLVTAARKPFVALAQQVSKFASRTPERYHKPAAHADRFKASAAGSSSRLKLTIPQSPAITKPSINPKGVPSTEQLEEELMAQIAAQPFKARPVNAAVMNSQGDYGVPRIPKKELTEPEPFSLTERMANAPKAAEQPVVRTGSFRARSVPKSIFKGPSGLPERMGAKKLTVPMSPAITKPAPKAEAPEPVSKATFKANPVPDMERAFHPTLPARKVVPQHVGGNLEKDTVSSAHHRGQWEASSAPPEVQRFVAHPAPKANNPDSLPSVPVKPTTSVQPFRLESHRLGLKLREQHLAKIRAESEKDKATRQFHAQPASVLEQKPFSVVKSDAPLCQISEFALNGEQRAQQRATYNAGAKLRAHRAAEEAAAQDKLREAAEEEEIRRLRQAITHKAQPVRNYRPMVVRASEKMLTEPVSPMIGKRHGSMRV